MTSRGDFTIELGTAPTRRRARRDDAMRLLVIADFSGASPAPPTFAVERVTADSIDATLARFAPLLPIAAADPSSKYWAMSLDTLDDLHPDHLAAVLGDLRQLLSWAQELANPATEAAAIAALEAATGPLSRPAAPSAAAPAVEPAASNDELFRRLLDKKGGSSQDDAKERVNRLIKSALAPQTVAKSSDVAAAARARIAERLNARCGQLLREPKFRSVERAWRSVQWLLSRLDDRADVYLLDLSKEKLAAHLAELDGRIDRSPLANAFAAESDGGFDLIVGDYSFDLTVEDITLLATLGALAARAGTTLFAHGDLRLVGCDGAAAVESPGQWSYADEQLGALWAEFRRHPAAKAVALAAPRFLLRQPYGQRTDPVTRFAFEELPVRPSSDCFLWGNPALACALVAVEAGGADAGGDVADLPMPIYRDGTGDAIQPPLEFQLGERAQVALAARGLIPLVGGRNTDRVVIRRLECVAGE
jgi:type VI secretion system protein ImpC